MTRGIEFSTKDEKYGAVFCLSDSESPTTFGFIYPESGDENISGYLELKAIADQFEIPVRNLINRIKAGEKFYYDGEKVSQFIRNLYKNLGE